MFNTIRERRERPGETTHIPEKEKYHMLHRVSSITSPSTRLRLDLESKAEPESEREHTTNGLKCTNTANTSKTIIIS
jgi:hypothetical protein